MEFDFKHASGVGFEQMIPQASQHAINLIKSMLTYTEVDRITPMQALKHPYFSDMKPEGKPARFFPYPQGLSAAEGDSAAGTVKENMFPPIERKKSIPKILEKNSTMKKKGMTLDNKTPML